MSSRFGRMNQSAPPHRAHYHPTTAPQSQRAGQERQRCPQTCSCSPEAETHTLVVSDLTHYGKWTGLISGLQLEIGNQILIIFIIIV